MNKCKLSNSQDIKLFQLALIIFIAVLINNPAISDTKKIKKTDYITKQNQLQKTKEDLLHLQKNISKKINEKNELLIEVRNIEKNIASLNNNYQILVKEKKILSESLLKIEKSLKQNNNKKVKQEKLILELVKQLHRAGYQQDLQIIFEQNSPENIDRELNYLIFIERAYQKEISRFNSLIRRDIELRKDVESQKNRIHNNQKNLLNEKDNLDLQYRKRKDVIKIIEKEIKSKEDKIKSLKDNQRVLSDLLSNINRIINKPYLPDSFAESAKTNLIKNGEFFLRSQGALSWPAKGVRKNSFGDTKKDSGIKWKGVFIASNLGSDVKAIFPGRVVFSEWLKGQGLLIIIDHGKGYMSLYGQNRNLLKQTGDWVESGEIISHVGNSGGKENNGLYFEMRKSGMPIDPAIWCLSE